MAWQAKSDFPEIDFEQSIMVGDSPSDIAFGRNLGMITVFIDNRNDIEEVVVADYRFGTLGEFADELGICMK